MLAMQCCAQIASRPRSACSRGAGNVQRTVAWSAYDTRVRASPGSCTSTVSCRPLRAVTSGLPHTLFIPRVITALRDQHTSREQTHGEFGRDARWSRENASNARVSNRSLGASGAGAVGHAHADWATRANSRRAGGGVYHEYRSQHTPHRAHVAATATRRECRTTSASRRKSHASSRADWYSRTRSRKDDRSFILFWKRARPRYGHIYRTGRCRPLHMAHLPLLPFSRCLSICTCICR